MELITDNNDRINIGQLANMFNVSRRTLRLYHDMELLIPQYVDDRTGYRYYSRTQFPRLEMIMQMKTAGLSLQRIKTMLNTRNISMFEALLSEQIDELDKKIQECTLSRDSLVKQLTSCKHFRNPPALDSIFIEFIPKRNALVFDIEEYDFLQDYPEGSPWEKALDKIKYIFSQNNISLTFFQQVGCMISKEALMQNKYLCSGAFILTEGVKHNLPQSSFPAGTYVCMYRRYIAMDGKSESTGLRELLKYIKENGYQIVGSYLCDVIAETSIFDYDDRNILAKLQIPVKIIDE